METQNKTESLEQNEIKNLLLVQITPLKTYLKIVLKLTWLCDMLFFEDCIFHPKKGTKNVSIWLPSIQHG